MRGWKIAGIAAAALIGLLAGALLLAWLLFDPNDYKDRLQSAFREASGRELRLEGPLSLSIFPWLAVETGAASVSNRDGFGNEPFASLERARLGVRLWPLLTRRRVEFGPVRVDGLALRLAVARDGRNNWSDLLDRLSRKEPKPASREPAPARPAELSIASVTLREASLHFADAQAGSRYAIEHWMLETGRLHPRTPFELDTALDAVRNERALGRFELHARVDLSLPDSVVLEETRGTAQWPREGKPPLDIGLSAPRITLVRTTRDIAVDALVAKVGDARLETTLAIRQGAAGPRVTGTVGLPETSLRALLDALGVAVPRTQHPDALRRLKAHSRVRYSAARGLELDGVDLTLDDTRLTGRIALPDLDRLALRFDLRGDSIDLDRYLPPKSAPAPQPAPPVVRATGDDGLRKLDARGSLALGRAVIARIPLEHVDADVRLGSGQFTLAPLRARAFGGSVVTRLQYDMLAAVPSLRVDQQLRDVDVAAMLGQLIEVHALEGRGSANFSLHTRGADPGQMLANLSGPFDLTVTDGALLGADMWFEIERAIAAAQFRKDAVQSKGSGRTEFDRLTARGTIGNRTLHNDHMEFFTDFAQVHGRGDVDYGDGTLDLDLVAKLLKTPPGRLLGVKVSRVKGADIPLRVTGTLTEPKVRPDVSSLLEAIAKDALKQPFEGKVREQLEKIFKF